MKTKIFGVLTLASIIMACLFIGMFAGTLIAYCGILMLLVAAIFACACFESMPKSKYYKIAKKITNFMTED